jgi:hypothetical protein
MLLVCRSFFSLHQFSVLRCLGLLFCAVTVGHSHAQTGWQNVYDFMVQNVCISAKGVVLEKSTPLDDTCIKQRNLMPGELMPYNKYDWPNDNEKRTRIRGYQRSDSFPISTKRWGDVVAQTFDFGSGNASFNQFDPNDGGQLVAFSEKTASIIMTEDATGGLQLMASPLCNLDRIQPTDLFDSWVLADNRAESLKSGSTIAKLRISRNFSCPTAFDSSYTEWKFEPHLYRSNLNTNDFKSLQTLISSHYGGSSVAGADHMEQFYFTRELGWTRWERWVNLTKSKKLEADTQRASALKSTKRCLELQPAISKEWVLVDCREWTNLHSSENPSDKSPEFWIKRLRSLTEIELLFK